MKKLFSVFCAFVLVMTAFSAFALEEKGYAESIENFSFSDEGFGLDAFGEVESLEGQSFDFDAGEEGSDLPSLQGPFSGNLVEVKADDRTMKIHEDFKFAMDTYEEFLADYLEIMNDPEFTDDSSEMMTYLQMQYSQTLKEFDRLDGLTAEEKSWTEDETAYYSFVMEKLKKSLPEGTETNE